MQTQTDITELSKALPLGVLRGNLVALRNELRETLGSKFDEILWDWKRRNVEMNQPIAWDVCEAYLRDSFLRPETEPRLAGAYSLPCLHMDIQAGLIRRAEAREWFQQQDPFLPWLNYAAQKSAEGLA